MNNKKRIKKIDPLQLGKVNAVILFFISIVFLIPYILIMLVAGSTGLASSGFGGFTNSGMGMSFLLIIFIPLLYTIIGFISGVIFAFAYNQTYKFHKGVELQFTPDKNEITKIGR